MQTRWRTVMGLGIVMGLLGLSPISPVSGFVAGGSAVTINEIHYDNSGADTNEAIEVAASAGVDLFGWSLVLYNGNNGTEYRSVALSGSVPDLGGGLGVVNFPIGGIQNGAPDGVALVNSAGSVVEFFSWEGVFTAVGGAADGLLSTSLGVAESSSTNDDQSLQRAASGVWGGPFCASLGQLNVATPDVTCPVPVVEAFIHDVQGSGSASPMIGQRVIVEGVVVGDEEGPAPALRGFFVQEEDSDADADPLTSEGVFVFNFNNDDVNLGDVVRVEGTVEERFGNTQLGSFASVEVLDVAPRAATPSVVSFPLADENDLEAVEGMAVRFPQELVISEYFNYDRFGEIVVALPAPGEDRPFNPTALFGQDTAEAADRLDLNRRSRITVDDGNSFQNPSNPIHPINRELFSLDNAFRGGDQVTELTGPIFFSFGKYRILPWADGGFDSFEQTEAPKEPDDVDGDIQVATLNALNYFLTVDVRGSNCGPDPLRDIGCRGADNHGELARQRVKLLNALEGIDADIVGLVEVENTVGVEPLADIVDGLNTRLGAGTYAYIAAGNNSVVGTDAIKVGLIYKPESVSPVGTVAILDTAAFLDPRGTGRDRNRAAVAASFSDNDSGEVFSVVVNHFKSKGSRCGGGDDHPLAGNCALTRTLAAAELVDWLATNPTGTVDDDWLIVGDLNSYDHEDTIATLEAAGFTDLVGAEEDGEHAYSFVFDGQFGYLDYIMSSASLTDSVTGATEWHINSDEPDVFDYDTSFKSNYQDSLFDPTTPFRSSDHDAAIIGLEFDDDDDDDHDDDHDDDGDDDEHDDHHQR